MALVRHKGSDNWYWRFSVNGKPKQGSCFTANKSIAARYEAKKRKEFEDQKMFGAKQTISLKDALQQYLDSRHGHPEYSRTAGLINKLLGSKTKNAKGMTVEVVSLYGIDEDKPFHLVSTADIQKLVLARRKEGMQDASIIHELTVFNQTVKLMKNLGYATPDIELATIKKDSAIKRPGSRDRFLTKEEEDRVLAALDPENIDPEISGAGPLLITGRRDTADLICILLDTAARHTEISHLPLSSIDLEKREIYLYRTKVKNASIISMTDRVFEIISRRIKNKHEGQLYLFEKKDGTGPRRYVDRALKSACARAAVKPFTFHTLRHTAASRLAQNGLPLYDLSKLMGHSTPAQTARYAHLIPNQSMKSAISILNSLNQGA